MYLMKSRDELPSTFEDFHQKVGLKFDAKIQV